ncbi:MAG: type II secretion system protein GspN [Desulfohalobiaceae bacterium]
MSLRGRQFTLGAAYAATALILAFVTAIAFFPYKALEKRIETAFRERTGVSLRLMGTGYSPPFGLGADRAVVSRYTSGEPAVELTGIDVQWRPWALFWGEQRFAGEARSCGGGIGAVLRFDSFLLRDSGAGSLELKNISLKECAGTLQSGRMPTLSGRLRGEAGVRNLRAGLKGMSGNASLSVEEMRVDFEDGVLRGLAIQDAGFRGKLRKEGGTLHVSEAQLRSPGIEASLSGEIRLKEQPEKSGLDLRTELEFHPGRLAGQPENPLIGEAMARKRLELALKGSVASPRIRRE